MLTASNITFSLGILALIFSIYRYFRDPQVKSDRQSALTTQGMKYMSEASERRFETMQQNFQQLLTQSNNHIHTVDTKVDTLGRDITGMGKEIVRLATIIEERLPKQINN